MWTQILLKPFWPRMLILAGCNFALDTVMRCADWLGGHPPVEPFNVYGLAAYVAGSLIFGLLVATFTGNSNQAYTRALFSLDPAQRTAAVDAAFRGPVPDDPSVLYAAIRVAGQRLSVARFWRAIFLMFVGLPLLATGVRLAQGTFEPATSAPSHWIFSAVLLYLMVSACCVSISVKHRVAVLRQAWSHVITSSVGS